MNAGQATPNDRMLMVLEYLDGAQTPVKQADIARDCGISPATLSRIIGVLSEWGYVLRSNNNQVIGNFRFQRNVRMSEGYQHFLNQLINEIGSDHEVVAEVIVNAGTDLFWQSSTAATNRKFSIRARPGFRRGLMELDVISRLYLARLSQHRLQELAEQIAFSTTGVDMRLLAEADAMAIIEASRPKLVDWDFDGNRNGIRRFATYVTDIDGEFAHLLSLAEPATPTRDRAAHEAHMSQILLDARERLTEVMRREGSSPQSCAAARRGIRG